jgi:predicted PurR-regulated permease PerM
MSDGVPPVETPRSDRPSPDITKLSELFKGPLDMRSVALSGLFLLSVLYTLYLAKAVVLPITLALLLSFLFAPIVRALKRLAIPEPLGAAVLLLVAGSIASLGTYRLAEPAASWLTKAPQALRQIEDKIHAIKKPVEKVTEATELLGKLTGIEPNKTQEEELKRSSLSDLLFNQTAEFLAGSMITAILLYFLLASGNLFLLKLVKVIPRLEDKRCAVEIVRQIEEHLSTYLLTVTVINLGLGIIVGMAMSILEMPNPLLWGVMACLLTFIPYLGHTIGFMIVTLVAALTFDELGRILMVGGSYAGLAGLEGMLVTPMILGHRLTLNPVIIIIGLFLWGWMWGVVGAILAVPLIAALKIVCDHIEPLAPIGEFLGR